MNVVDKKGNTHVLPDDPWWLLRMDVKPGECVPFRLWIWFHWQTQVTGGWSA